MTTHLLEGQNQYVFHNISYLGPFFNNYVSIKGVKHRRLLSPISVHIFPN